MKKLLFLLLLSSSIYAQSLWKDKNSLLSPTGSRGIGAPSLYGFSIGDTSIIRLRSGAVQFLNGGSWYAIPVPSNYVLYSDSVTKYMTPTSFLSAFDTRLGTKSTTNLVEGTNLYYLDSRARASISSSATGLTYTNTTGIFSWTSGYSGLTDSMRTLWSGKQTYYANLSSIGALANASGWLKNNGSGTFSYSTPSRTDLGFGTMALADSILFKSEIAGLYVPLSRTVNGKALSSNISLAYSDLTVSPINIGSNSITSGAITSNGSVFINYISDPTSGNLFAVNGNSYFNGTGTFTGLLSSTGLNSVFSSTSGDGTIHPHVFLNNTSTAIRSVSTYINNADDNAVSAYWTTDGLGTEIYGYAGSFIGTYSNHPFTIITNHAEVVKFGIDKSATFAGSVTSAGLTLSSGAFTGNSVTRGTDAFTTTATADTVAITGASVNDIYTVSYITAVTAAEAPLSVVSTATGFIVTRPAGTTSGASYAWMRQK